MVSGVLLINGERAVDPVGEGVRGGWTNQWCRLASVKELRWRGVPGYLPSAEGQTGKELPRPHRQASMRNLAARDSDYRPPICPQAHAGARPPTLPAFFAKRSDVQAEGAQDILLAAPSVTPEQDFAVVGLINRQTLMRVLVARAGERPRPFRSALRPVGESAPFEGGHRGPLCGGSYRCLANAAERRKRFNAAARSEWRDR